jgi:hypothetical protein
VPQSAQSSTGISSDASPTATASARIGNITPKVPNVLPIEKGDESRQHEHYGGKKRYQNGSLDQAADVFPDTELAHDLGRHPREEKDAGCGEHRLDALDEAARRELTRCLVHYRCQRYDQHGEGEG